MVEFESAWPGSVLSCETLGIVVRSAGKAVRNDGVVVSVEVNWISIAWVSTGMPEHDPLFPVAVIVMVSSAPSGVERARSRRRIGCPSSRHGAMAVIKLPPPVAACTRPMPPALADIAATAAMPIHSRTNHLVRSSSVRRAVMAVRPQQRFRLRRVAPYGAGCLGPGMVGSLRRRADASRVGSRRPLLSARGQGSNRCVGRGRHDDHAGW